MMLAMCSAPLQVMLHPVKSMVRILVEYLTLWQMTEIYKKKQLAKQYILNNTCKIFKAMQKLSHLLSPHQRWGT